MNAGIFALFMFVTYFHLPRLDITRRSFLNHKRWCNSQIAHNQV